MSLFEVILDNSKAGLKQIPEPVLDMTNLKMLFLEQNLLLKLPDNFFFRLPNLMWLDLRNNQLEELPRSIAHHEHLENLLLAKNNIRKLPNELGLAVKLTALQVAENPLVYPPKKIIQEGTKSIKKYLKEQYEIECAKNAELRKDTYESREEFNRQLLEMQEERVIKVHEEGFDSSVVKIDKNRWKDSTILPKQNKRTLGYFQNKVADPKSLSPTLHVNKIEHPKKNLEGPLKIIHNVNKSGSKISLKSYFNQSGLKGNLAQIPKKVLKQGWLNKLRILLNDQERILQQERNLRALSSWRQRKLSTPETVNDSNASTRRIEPPYATYPEYSKIPSRSELAYQLQTFLKDADVVRTRPVQTSQLNLDKVINDLIQQLKNMENNDTKEVASPRSEMEHAGKQIQAIVDIHKKLLQLKSTANYL